MIAGKVLGLTQRVWEEDYFVGSQCSSMAFTTRVEQAVSHLYLRNTQTFCSVAISIAFTALRINTRTINHMSFAPDNCYPQRMGYMGIYRACCRGGAPDSRGSCI